MYASDKTLVCQDCNQEFVFSASEQQFYADRQFSEPRRCPSCRAARKAQRGDFGGGAHSGGGGGSRGIRGLLTRRAERTTYERGFV